MLSTCGQVLRPNCRAINTAGRHTFFAFYARHRIADVIPTKIVRRSLHGKNESSTSEALTLVRWTKLLWNKMFGKYLLATNVIGSGVLMVVGDVVAQEYEYRRGLRSEDRYDVERIYRMFVAGALQGPLHHYVYAWMDRIMPQRTFRTTIKKILIDQLFMSPACILLFFYSVCYLEHQTLEATHKEIMEKFAYIYMLDWLTWPAAQYVNFRYLDTKYRVAFVNVCTAVYNVLISYMKHDFNVHLPLEIAVHEPQNKLAPAESRSQLGSAESKNSLMEVTTKKVEDPNPR
ncbi:mpv17-like protein 2 [Scaptodrosophila lebanonensis]|uniref:Mpv17-like protein 2 n=1 Tax=Drosophila lebanonensis TaxID=7225 RepID=A0A6J2UAZ7_DROLE|nr:mpv17-like protein 2 [Scaptodrosophila lebanonensis]